MTANAELLVLKAGKLDLTLSPDVGGSIARFEFASGEHRVPILRACKGVSSHVLATASFPLVPFVNRIRGGRFTFRGTDVRLQPNMASDPSPLHGQGWLNAWQIVSCTDTVATLEFHHSAGEWPWDYVARQVFALDDSGLVIDLVCRNLSSTPMPCGLGQHPYFHCSAETRLRTTVGHAWTIDEQVLPVERVAAIGRFDLSDRAVRGLGLDHGFDGWGGKAILVDPAWPFELTMSSTNAKFFQLYSPAAGDIFVIEPVTHANAALNAPEAQWRELGMRILQPSEEMSLRMRLDVVHSATA